MEAILTTLCYLERDGKYLMLFRNRKENDINKGKWIGLGGKFEQGESPEECACREVFEETGYVMENARFRGVVTFVTPQWMDEYMFLFTCEDFSGEEHPCNEGELAWIPKDQVETLNLWEGDRIFLKLLAEDAPFFSLKLVYSVDGNLIRAVLDGREIAG
ncbi:MAG: NUDIX hydrolase [Lachnospiraceae bacterium]